MLSAGGCVCVDEVVDLGNQFGVEPVFENSC